MGVEQESVMQHCWHIDLFGGLRAVRVGPARGSEPLVVERFPTRKTAQLLAYLAQHRDRSHSREALVDLFWPEVEPAAGRQSLSRALSSLRNVLEPPGVPSAVVLVASRASVCLRADAVTTDVAEFEAALRDAARAASQVDRAEALRRAVDLYHGELLLECLEDWALDRRGWLAEQFLTAVSSLAELLIERGDPEEAIEAARRGIDADPLREESHRLLIRLLRDSGRPAAARARYHELARLLDREMGAEPDPATRSLLDSPDEDAGAWRRKAAGYPPEAGGGADRSAPLPVRCQAKRREDERRQGDEPSPAAPRRGSGPPSGTVTFLLTDIEGSTAQWERSGPAFAATLERHRALLREVVSAHDGWEVKELGDGFLFAFASAGAALGAANAGQEGILASELGLRVRMALHTGDVEPEKGDYHSLVIHRATRVLLAAHGGQILCSAATAALLSGDLQPGIRLTDLGLFRLRGLTALQPLFQVEYPGTAQREYPPPRAEAAVTGHLPLPLTRFVGREAEIRCLEEMLVPPARRLVTLIGPGGTGKTRLSLAVAERLRPVFRGAVWFVPLADLTEAGQIPEAIRDALGLPRTPGCAPTDAIAAHLSDQPALLILDNLEHLAETAGRLVVDLLRRTGPLTCLVTSRCLLRVEGEQEFAVAPLAVPEAEGRAGGSLAALSECESVALFVDRARAARPDFQLTSGNAAAIVALCRRLEGIPLAIELAAGRVRTVSLTQMVEHLATGVGPGGASPLHRLESRRRDASPRHRSLWAALAWSFDLLPDRLKRFFCRLSVFRGGWTPEAAAAVCEDSDAGSQLEELRDASMVLAEERDGLVRFRMLETMRQFGSEMLSHEERRATEARHASWFLTLAEEAVPRLTTAEQNEWFTRLVADHDNLRAALDHCVATGDAETGLRMAVALSQFWIQGGYFADGQKLVGRLLELPAARNRTPLRARGLNVVGSMARFQNNLPAARAYHRESLEISRELKDRQGTADALRCLGTTVSRQGDYASAERYQEESLAIARELNDLEG